MLTKRQNDIIDILTSQKDWIIGKDLAKYLSVSDRTIRNDIVAINNFYKEMYIESNIRKGYRIQNSKKRCAEKQQNKIPENGNERRSFILKRLLQQGQINLYDIAKEIYISEFSVENDINKIRKLLENYPGLTIGRKINILQIFGEEREKRQLYEELIAFEMNGNLLNLNKLAENFEKFDLLKVKEILKEIFEECDYRLNERQIPEVMIHIGILLERNLSYHFLKEREHKEDFDKMQEYKISAKFFETMSNKLAFKITEAEVVEFAVYLKSGKKNEYYERNQLEQIVSDLVTHIIVEIKEHFDIDFSEDREFRLGLELHINSLLKRHYEKIEIDNTCLEEVKRKYPLIFEMGVWVSKIIGERLKITISENEISFISLHIGSAYERANLRKKYRCILICPHNQTVIDLCVQKLINRFNERLEIVKCVSYFEEALIIENDPDVILTTQPIVHSLDITTVEISMFLDYKDEAAVFQTLNRLDQIRYKNNFQFFILNLMREEIFTFDLEGKNPEEIISSMCDMLYSRGYVKPDFKEGVLKRESLSATSFFHGFAIPHSMTNESTIHSAISTAILKKPVKWGNYEVRFVLLLAITEENRNLLKIFFDWLNDVTSHAEKFGKLLEVRDYQSFVSTLL